MALKYWQLNLKGAKSLDEIHAAVGRGGANIVRIHVEANETQVYLAGDESMHPHLVEAIKTAGALQETLEPEVTRL
jgi:isopentenyl diphosphate isomerase/L-lactate dehydrogenase-like FMN-dependent dehydrogenase